MAVKRTPEQERAHLEAQLKLMLKKAETTSPEEAEMIMAQVEKLMLKLGLEDVMALTEDKKSEGIITVEVSYEGVYASAWIQMAYAIVLALGDLQAIRSDVYDTVKWKKTGLKIIIVGFVSDANRAKTLIDSLSLQCITAVSRHMKNEVSSYHTASEKYNIKRSFIIGFGRGAGSRIERIRTEVVNETASSEPGTALVLSSRRTQVAQRFDEIFSRTKTTRATKVVGDGYGAGVVAGRQARTGEASVGRSGSKAIDW